LDFDLALRGGKLVLPLDGVAALSYGASDLALSVHGSVKTYEANTFVKMKVVVAARAAGVDPLDKVYFDIRNTEGFRAEAREAKELGYSCRHVIHPDQIPVANEVFNPSREELEWAEKVVKAYELASSKGRGALIVDGALVDAVHYGLAKSLHGSRPEGNKPTP